MSVREGDVDGGGHSTHRVVLKSGCEEGMVVCGLCAEPERGKPGI